MTTLQTHYYLKDNSHSLEAKIFHKCQGHIIYSIEEISEILNIPILLEVYATTEGGLKDWIKIEPISSNTIIIALFTSLVPIIMAIDPEMRKVKIENLRADTQLKKQQYEQASKSMGKESQEILSQVEEIEKLLQNIEKSQKLKYHVSEYYKGIDSSEKVTHLAICPIEKDEKAYTVQKGEFPKFFFEKEELSPLSDSDATIEIISPVLNGSRIKWRGLYKGKLIEFSIDDKDFKRDVTRRKLKFSHGNTMSVSLEIGQKLSDEGNIINNPKAYKVIDVYAVDTEDGHFETVKGVRKRKYGSADENSTEEKTLPLFSVNNKNGKE